MDSRPTVSDVARLAGVSAATVSRVLRGDRGFTEEVGARVMAVVEKIGYRPLRRHSPVEAHRPWLVVLVPSVVGQFMFQVVEGVQQEAEKQGILTALLRVTGGQKQLTLMLQQMRSLSPVGIVSVGVGLPPEAWIAVTELTGAVVVVLNPPIDHPRIGSITVDFSGGARRGVQHLIDSGHVRIAYLGDSNNRVSAIELAGVQEELAAHGLAYLEEYRFSSLHSAEGVSQGVSRLMALPQDKRPTAIFAFDDEVAIDVMNSLRYYQFRIPDDVSVMGFDNIPMAAHTFPPLSTIDVPKLRIGRQMVSLAGQLFNNHGSSLGSTLFHGDLIVRRSTGPVASRETS